jgi:MoaD family protein
LLKINVFYLGDVYSTIGKEMETLEMDSGVSARGLLSALIERYGDCFRESIMDVKSTVENPWLKIMISLNGRDIKALGGLDRELNEGDSVALMTMVSGG